MIPAQAAQLGEWPKMLRMGPAMGRCLVSELENESGDEETYIRATQRQDTGGDVLGDRPSGECE